MKVLALLFLCVAILASQVTISVPVAVHSDAVAAVLAHAVSQSCSIDGPVPNGVVPDSSLTTGTGEVCYEVSAFGTTFGVAVANTVLPSPLYPTQAYFYLIPTAHLYRSTGSEWVDLGVPSDGTRMINMVNGNLYQFASGVPVLQNGAAAVLAREQLRVAAQAATKSVVNSAVVWALVNNPSLLPASLTTANTAVSDAEAAKTALIETLTTTEQ